MIYDFRFCATCKSRHAHFEANGHWYCIECQKGVLVSELTVKTLEAQGFAVTRG